MLKAADQVDADQIANDSCESRQRIPTEGHASTKIRLNHS
jgi:hypothetical protein